MGRRIRWAALGFGMIAVAGGCGPDSGDSDSSANPVASPREAMSEPSGEKPRSPGSEPASAQQSAAVSFSSGGAARCHETYSLAALARRSFAFDGEVVEVTLPAEAQGPPQPTQIKFVVHQWYRGGAEREVIVRATGVGLATSEPTFDARPGARLLVAGNDRIAWSCGFTQPRTDQVASEWQRVFQNG
jgi:hypothetical protein